MKTKEKLTIFTIVIAMLLFMIIPNTAHAALQSNGGTPKTDTINNWLLNIRNMQATGGTLGLTDTIDANLTSSNKNLDIHMEKNTEYGALILLSASSYGNPNNIVDGETTTGNASGVMMKINQELVVAGCTELGNNVLNFKNALERYKNVYTTTYVEKSGDAIKETGTWHKSNCTRWLMGPTTTTLLRAYSKSIFSYDGEGTDNAWDAPYYTRSHATRAVIVVGTNI